MSDTPRTDALADRFGDIDELDTAYWSALDLATQLERELALSEKSGASVAEDASECIVALDKATLQLRDQLAAAALPAIYEHHTNLTDLAAKLAYEQADEMLRAR